MSNLLHLNILGKGPPLVLLHGWGWHSGIWTPLTSHLVDKFQLFIPDLPGFGYSPDYTENYTFEEIAALLFKSVPESALWLGWSLGGMLAWWVALHYPEKITQLITVAASPKFLDDENWAGVPLNVLEKFSMQLENNHEETLSDFLRLQLRGSTKSQELYVELKEQLSVIQASALTGGLKLLRETDLRSDLATLKIPSLHIFGGMDALVPSSVIHSLQQLIPYGKCEIIKRAAHIPFLSHQEEFLRLINREW